MIRMLSLNYDTQTINSQLEIDTFVQQSLHRADLTTDFCSLHLIRNPLNTINIEGYLSN